MIPSPEVRNRIDELRRELDDAIENAKIRAKGDYWISFFLMLIALGASAVAGIGGLSEKFGSQLTGSLALIPGAIAVLASNLKFQQKSNWHYRRCRASLTLKSKLVFRCRRYQQQTTSQPLQPSVTIWKLAWKGNG